MNAELQHDMSEYSQDEKITTESQEKSNDNTQKLIFLERYCEYDIIRNVIRDNYNLEVTENVNSDFDLLWHDKAVDESEIRQLKPHQKYNHYPSMFEIYDKVSMGKNLNVLEQLFPEDYDIFPKTWCLPKDYDEFINYFDSHEGKTYIVKPSSTFGGTGIFLTQTKDNVDKDFDAVIQEYIPNPYLLDNCKFDIRLYVLVKSIDPLRVYICKEGLIRVCTSEYEQPTDENINNHFMHLANTNINKLNPNFKTEGENGSKRLLGTLYKQLESEGVDTAKLQAQMNDIVVKTLISAQPKMKANYRSYFPEEVCGSQLFEIIAFDFMIDDNAKPYVLEVNYHPAWGTDTKTDMTAKYALSYGAYKLLNLTYDQRTLIQQDSEKSTWSESNKHLLKKYHNMRNHKYEVENQDYYTLAYPLVSEFGAVLYDPEHEYTLNIHESDGNVGDLISHEQFQEVNRFSSDGTSELSSEDLEKLKQAEKYYMFNKRAAEIFELSALLFN